MRGGEWRRAGMLAEFIAGMITRANLALDVQLILVAEWSHEQETQADAFSLSCRGEMQSTFFAEFEENS